MASRFPRNVGQRVRRIGHHQQRGIRSGVHDPRDDLPVHRRVVIQQPQTAPRVLAVSRAAALLVQADRHQNQRGAPGGQNSAAVDTPVAANVQIFIRDRPGQQRRPTARRANQAGRHAIITGASRYWPSPDDPNAGVVAVYLHIGAYRHEYPLLHIGRSLMGGRRAMASTPAAAGFGCLGLDSRYSSWRPTRWSCSPQSAFSPRRAGLSPSPIIQGRRHFSRQTNDQP